MALLPLLLPDQQKAKRDHGHAYTCFDDAEVKFVDQSIGPLGGVGDSSVAPATKQFSAILESDTQAKRVSLVREPAEYMSVSVQVRDWEIVDSLTSDRRPVAPR